MTTTQPNSNPALWEAAYHEAGHAIAAVRNSLPVRSVDVVYTGHQFGCCDYSCEGATIEQRALCLLAAGAAERRHTGSRRAYDASDLDNLRVLFKGSRLDPDLPYAERHPDSDAERQRVVDEWYSKAEAFVEREWHWIDRVAQALMKHERLTGDEVKRLCSHPVVRIDTTNTETDEARRTAAVARDQWTRTAAPQTKTADLSKYDAKLFAAAHDRLLGNARSLTDDDIEQFAAVDSRLADRARAKRSGFVEAEDAELKKIGRRRVTWKLLIQRFYRDFVLPLLKMQQMDTRQAHARIAALEKQVAQLQSAGSSTELEARVKELEQTPFVKFCGVWTAGTAYGPGDATVHHSAFWICKQDTVGEPGKDFMGWQLALKRGAATERT